MGNQCITPGPPAIVSRIRTKDACGPEPESSSTTFNIKGQVLAPAATRTPQLQLPNLLTTRTTRTSSAPRARAAGPSSKKDSDLQLFEVDEPDGQAEVAAWFCPGVTDPEDDYFAELDRVFQDVQEKEQQEERAELQSAEGEDSQNEQGEFQVEFVDEDEDLQHDATVGDEEAPRQCARSVPQQRDAYGRPLREDEKDISDVEDKFEIEIRIPEEVDDEGKTVAPQCQWTKTYQNADGEDSPTNLTRAGSWREKGDNDKLSKDSE